MHILMIPSAYPTEDAPIRGVFFKEQAIAINSCKDIEVGVIYNETRRISNNFLKDIKKFHFQKEKVCEDKINTVRLKGWNILTMRNSLGVNLWINQSISLFKDYIKDYGEPDLIHIQCGLYGGMVGKKIKELYGIPYIITEHASVILNNRLSEYQKSFIKDVYNNADLLISISEKLKSSMERYTDRKIVVIPNMIDSAVFKYKKTSKEIFRFITVCNLKKDKNVESVIRAFSKKFKHKELVELIIIGDGPEKKNLEDTIKELGLCKKVKLLGAKSREELPNYYNSSDAFILASDYETFGVVYIEALASGLPIIATKCGGPEEFFEDNFGYIINKGNQNELELAMKQIYNNIHLFNSKDISLSILDKFDNKVISNKIIQEYIQVLGRRDEFFI